jgi:hypothetical protein
MRFVDVATEPATSNRPVAATHSKAQRNAASLPLFNRQGMGAGLLADSFPGPVGLPVAWHGWPATTDRAEGGGGPGYRPPGKAPMRRRGPQKKA